MDYPKSVYVVGPLGQERFKAAVGSFDISDRPYTCRGYALRTGARCKIFIASKHIYSLPEFPLQGAVAFYRQSDSYGGRTNCLAAYYCRHHTDQIPFVPLKRADTFERNTVIRETEVRDRRPLTEKSANVAPMRRVKIEEVEEAVAELKAVKSQSKPAPIVMPATIRSPKLDPESPVKSPKMRVYRDADEKRTPVIKSEEEKAATVDKATTTATIKHRDSEIAELKASNIHYLAAMQHMASQIEALTARLDTVEKAKTKVIVTEVSNVEAPAAETKATHVEAPSTNTKQSEMQDAADMNKRPTMTVEAVQPEVDSEKRQTGGKRKSLLPASCKCM